MHRFPSAIPEHEDHMCTSDYYPCTIVHMTRETYLIIDHSNLPVMDQRQGLAWLGS
ncbi:hypothetical protein CY34DRAFT_808875 [Suillus luteus UH-Slu-Lm8-n1]|uniref:Uncharacterized protein n=1 Tax=Suillus luteus UH-Slu-Lm8-n1 TaxID=930992 RepID=A0A0D0AWZ9_9AGAM|nr:hypothetical protein CY34DRAFT_808875 [Suillus luteus UH-Slu-Lm8-n1]